MTTLQPQHHKNTTAAAMAQAVAASASSVGDVQLQIDALKEQVGKLNALLATGVDDSDGQLASMRDTLYVARPPSWLQFKQKQYHSFAAQHTLTLSHSHNVLCSQSTLAMLEAVNTPAQPGSTEAAAAVSTTATLQPADLTTTHSIGSRWLAPRHGSGTTPTYCTPHTRVVS